MTFAIWLNTQQPAALGAVVCGERNHEAVAHIKYCVGQRVEEVIAHHDPDGLHAGRGLRHGKEQYARHRHHGRAQKQPGPRLALFGARAVDDIAHDYVRHGVQHLADDGEYHEEGPAPEPREIQYVGVVDVQIRRQHRVQEQRAGRPEQIAEPLFLPAHILRAYAALKYRPFNPREQLFTHVSSSRLFASFSRNPPAHCVSGKSIACASRSGLAIW